MQETTVTHRTLREAMAAAKQDFDDLQEGGKYQRGGKDIPYSELKDISNAIDKALYKHDIFVSTTYGKVENEESPHRTVITRIVHNLTGESEEYYWPITLRNPGDNHEIATAHTFGRRYNLLGAFDLTAKQMDPDSVVEDAPAQGPDLSKLKPRDVSLMADLIKELNGVPSMDELQATFNKHTEPRKALPQVLVDIYGIAKDGKKNEFQETQAQAN